MAKRHPAQDFFLSRLAASGVTEEQARLSGVVPATKDEARKTFPKLPEIITDLGMLIRYSASACRYRCNWDRKPKYLQPKGSGSLLFFPKVKLLDWEKVLASDRPIYIVEGELKALALCLNGFAAIGIGGVNSFVQHGVIHPELVKFFKDRVVYVVFDSDAENNPNVAVAAAKLQVEITDAGGTPMLIRIPFIDGDEYDKDKTGVDTFLRIEGARAFDELDKEDFELAKRMLEFNRRYVQCESPASVIRIPKQTVEPENLRQWSPERFFNFVESAAGKVRIEDGVNKDGTIKHKTVRASEHWVKDYAGRNLVNCMTFRPGPVGLEPERYITENGERKLNLWSGWNAEPVRDDELVKPFLALLLHSFSRETDKVRQELLLEFTLSWMAYPIQHPGAILEQALAFVGVQGSGKTLPFSLYGQLYGASFLVVGEDQLQSNFNSWVANRLFILGEEITGEKNNRQYANKLKTMITGKNVIINTKYVPEYKLPNYANYAFTTNDYDAFFLNDTDRRFFISRTPEVQLVSALGLEKVKYLDETWRRDQRCLNALMHYLLHYKIDPKVYKPAGIDPPRTEAKAHMMLTSMNAAQRWLKEFTEDEDKRRNTFTNKVRTLFRSEDLFNQFDVDKKQKHGMTDKAFTNALVDRFYKPLTYPVDGCKVRTEKVGTNGEFTLKEMKLNLWAIQPQYGGPERTLNKKSAAAIWNEENTK